MLLYIDCTDDWREDAPVLELQAKKLLSISPISLELFIPSYKPLFTSYSILVDMQPIFFIFVYVCTDSILITENKILPIW